jgi:formylglycine-generating enzyme required for sulfatase activity
MKVFLSYAAEDRDFVEPVSLALRAQGHRVFFDRDELPAGEEYDGRIRRAIETSDLLVFMLSPNSLESDSYALTELSIAQKSWEHPAGRLLPVVLRPVSLERVPAYVRAVTFLEPQGNVAASVADAVHRVARSRWRKQLKRAAMAAAAVSVAIALGYIFRSTWLGRIKTVGKDGAPVVFIPAGKFTMGDGEDSPLREVYLDGFAIDRYEVTVSRYGKFLETTGGLKPPDHWDEAAGDDNFPIVGVNWHDADAYCRWAEKRLPTEAEWERAARGDDGRKYPWGDDEPTVERANFGKNSDRVYKDGLVPVDGRAAGASPYGILDLAGNAAEWVADWYREGFAPGDARNPKGPDSGQGKVIRGGGWRDPPDRLRSSRPMYAKPEHRSDDVGFRCAADVRQ